MADNTRRPEDDDKNPVDPPTGENEVAGADWLISQLDAAPTGQFDTRQAPQAGTDPDGAQRPGRAGDNPVLAWWREKLIAADALVNPEPRSGMGDGSDATIEADADARVEVDDRADARREDLAAAEPVRPEPARFERPRPTANDADADDTDQVFLPEPAFTPAWTPQFRGDDTFDTDDRDDRDILADTNRGWGLDSDSDFSRDTGQLSPAPENELRDEAETGLIPSAEPPLYQPKSARDEVAPETAQVHDLAAEPDTDDAPQYITEDLDNFSWKLTANDRLDPRVHRKDSRDIVPSYTPAPAASDSDGDVDDRNSAVSGRRSRPDADDQTGPQDPLVADQPGPRRRTFAVPPARDETAPAGATAAAKPARKPLRAARPAAAAGAPRPVVLAAIGVVALLVLGGLFFLGSQLPGLLAGPAPSTSASPNPAASPTPTTPAAPAGPAAAGEQQWTALGGGECLEPYSSPWAETFTVVDCGEPHAAQMVVAGQVDEDPAAAYPGEDEILTRISSWCGAPGVLDADAAGEYDDLQVQGSYPVSEEQWADGQRTYYCFVSRSSGEPLTGSLTAPSS